MDLNQLLIEAAKTGAAIAAGAAIGISGFSEFCKFSTSVAAEAVAYQEAVVSTAEAVESTAAGPARAQWDANRAVAAGRIAALNAIFQETQTMKTNEN